MTYRARRTAEVTVCCFLALLLILCAPEALGQETGGRIDRGWVTALSPLGPLGVAPSTTTTEGDAILGAVKVREHLGVTGRGVRVGVLGTGLAGVFTTGCTDCGGLPGGPMDTNDLPPAKGTRDANGILASSAGAIVAKSFRADGDLEAGLSGIGNDGSALMEIVHDLAPDTTFYFANFQTDAEFNAAMNWLAGNVDIVVNDASFLQPPYDGTSGVSANAASALNSDVNPIRALITAAGNEGKSHYAGAYSDSGIDAAAVVGTAVPGYKGNFHQFAGTATTKDVCGLGSGTKDPVFVKAGSDLNVMLSWENAGNSASDDYDLWLLDSSGEVVAFSTNAQSSGPPLEFIDYVNAGDDAFFYVAVTNADNAAAPKQLHLFIRGAEPIAPNTAALAPAAACPNGTVELHNYNTRSGSVAGMGDAGGWPGRVISVGTVAANDPSTAEAFGAQGPTTDGRVKPDLSAVDGVAVSGAGGFPATYTGTGAAAAHVAGIAALVMQVSPCLASGSDGARIPSDARRLIYDSLTKSAVDLGTTGPDNTYGYGLVDAFSAATALLPTASAGGDLVIPANSDAGASVQPDSSASRDPAGCPLTYSWSGDCGTGTGAKPALSCPIGKSTVRVAVSNNGVTNSSASSLVTVTDYSVTSAPAASVNAGEPAKYDISVAPQGGAFANVVALSCTTTAPNAVCSVTPTSVVPGSSPRAATVTVNTVGTSAGNYGVAVKAMSNSLAHGTELSLALKDFAVSPIATSASIVKGETATYNVSFAPAAGTRFASPIDIACTGAPSKATCTVSPATVTPGTTAVPVTVTVKTTAAGIATKRPARSPVLLAAFAMIGAFGFAFVGRKKQRSVVLALILLLLAAATTFVGCGGGGTHTRTTNSDPGTPSGIYTLVVTGTSDSLVHTANLTLTVQ